MFTVDDEHELLALNRALMEVRYLARDVDAATRGSAHLSALHQRVIDTLIEREEAAGRPAAASRWRRWQEIDGRAVERPAIVAHLAELWSASLPAERKRAAVVNQLRPFTFTEHDVEDIIAELDAV